MANEIAIVLEKDTINFHAWDTRIDSMELMFEYIEDPETLKDFQTKSIWDISGTCISGILEGRTLNRVQAYEEYWHSWETFHPRTKINPSVE